jgi:predicted signal transduction protein with EAL and GGDEF domain
VRCVRATDTVGRLGGDEFVVLLEAPADADTVLGTVQRIRDALGAPVRCADDVVYVSASIGVLLSEDMTLDPEAALRNADIAMYEAKTHGRDSFRIFAAAMREHSAARLRLRTRLQKALTAGDLFVRYQPVVDLADGRIRGFEALLRWRVDPAHVLDAAAFVDTAEETGVLVAAGWNVLATACRQVREWRDAGFPVHVAVNLADRQVTDPELVDRVAAALTAAGIDGSALQLEITERAAMTPVAEAVAHLEECRAMGIELLIDDFGTGFSSLTALHELPLTAVKIDKTFVSRLDGGDEMVKAIIALSHSLGLDVVAEGIETAEQREQVQALGCPVGQGYLFYPALDADEATRLLRAQSPVNSTGGRPPT